ncbi:MAG: VCBS repeat-containing protein [Planctomycetes bacterium]|nr:VCBS repeat-containing protein [Planctomycetota bacterium]
MERLDAAQTGLDVSYPIDLRHPMKRLYVSGFACGGVAAGDVDGDGRVDLFFVGTSGRNRLFRQSGDFQFEEITESAGVNVGNPWGSAAAMVDVNGDGNLDIYVANYDAANQLFINDGEGVFVEQAAKFGLDVVDASLVPAFCDFDRDGDLDLYLLTNRFYRDGGFPTAIAAARDERGRPLLDERGLPQLLPEYKRYYRVIKTGPRSVETVLVPRRDRLLRNDRDDDGRVTFTDISEAAGISEIGHGLSATWWDYDDDGWPDIYVANDYDDPDHLYHNNRNGTFTDVIAEVLPHTSWFSMGADVADVNNDGRLDLFVADMSGTNHYKSKTTMGAMNNRRIQSVAGPPPQVMRNALYVSSGAGRFLEAAYLAGVADSDWSWAVKFGDLDCDGRIDLFISNGMTRNFNNSDVKFSKKLLRGRTEWDLYEATPPRPERNMAFRNRGDLQFEPSGSAWGLDEEGMSFASVWADFDRDGDLDLVVVNMDRPVSVYRNRSSDGHRVMIRLRGTGGNRFGIGAKVTIETEAGKQVRTLQPMTGFKSSNEPLLHFGLGEAANIRRLSVQWPSGHLQQFEQLAADRFYTISEPAEAPTIRAAPQSSLPPTMFRRSQALAHIRHHETPFDDFRRQPLLPNKLSQLGPGMAWGDVDGDGDDDLYLGAAAGDIPQLWINDGGGRFALGRARQFDDAQPHEDMAAVLLDVDGDGDLDLYVVSGGVECAAGNERLRDRLYLNDAQGHFTRASADALPDVLDSGSVVTAADFDRDGDLDLFVGGRVIPGAYPSTPRSRLLRNDGGRFVDVTETLAPALAGSGLVTSALWSDADGDGWLDLLVTHEWGPVKLFHNNEGKLVDHTQQAGLAERLGWWNGIAGGDVDGDGDIDYVVTNFGLNSKYHASQSRPALLYYGDFENRGVKKLVEADYEGEVLFPIRGRSCSTRAIPHLAQKFGSYKDFALADLAAIYTPKCLNDADRFEANELRTGLLINDGHGRFTFRALPRIAQIAPGFGVVMTDVDGDGHLDVYLVQNFFTPQLETGRMDGGLSQLLLGRGDGTFRPIAPGESGLVVPGDAKSLAVTDLNGDGRPDFVVGVNNDRLLAFENRSDPNKRILAVRLAGKPGNPTAVGARVMLKLTDGTQQTTEVYSGGGYLSQSSRVLFFGLGETGQVDELVIRWPDGMQSTHRSQGPSLRATLRQE